MQPLLRSLLALLLMTPVIGASAATHYFKARLERVQGSAAVSADGSALLAYDDVTNTLSTSVTYRNYTGSVTSHIHAADGGNVVSFAASSGPFTEIAVLTPAQEVELLASRLTLHLHLDAVPGGVIGGAVVPIDTTHYMTHTGICVVTTWCIRGSVTFDPASLRMEWNIRVQLHLADVLSAAHFHGPAGAGETTAPIALAVSPPQFVNATFPGPFVGSATLSAYQAAELVNGYWMFRVASLMIPPAHAQVEIQPVRLGNISTRMYVGQGADVGIAGFVIEGSAPKTVAIVAQGPSLTLHGIGDALLNPKLDVVRQSDQALIESRDDGNDTRLAGSPYMPADFREPAMLLTLDPGAYTAVVSGSGGTTGTALVAVYEADRPTVPMVNISTRARVRGGEDVMIAGFIIEGLAPKTVAITATGPSLAAFGIAEPLPNPTVLLVRSLDQSVVAFNDDWGSATNAAELQAAGFAPAHARESALLVTLPPGAYTAIVRSANREAGVGLVAVYELP